MPTLEELYATLQPQIEREAGHWCMKFPIEPGMSRKAVREDLIQDGWICAAYVLERFDPSRHTAFTTYLRTNMRHRFTNKLARAYTRLKHTKPLHPSHLPDDYDPNPAHFTLPEVWERLTLAGLSDTEMVLANRLMECDGSVKEVARRYALSVRSVQRAVAEIADKLRAA